MTIPKWIFPEGADQVRNCHVKFVKRFELATVPARVALKIAAVNYYRLSINGRLAGQGPARNTHAIEFYDTLQVAGFLTPGINTIEVLVRCMNLACSGVALAEPSLWLELEGIVCSDGTWRAGIADQEWPSDAPIFSPQNGIAEWRDLRYENTERPVKTIVLGPKSIVGGKKLLCRETPLPSETILLPIDIPVAATVPEADLSDREIARIFTYEQHAAINAAPFQELCLPGEHHVVLPQVADNGGVAIIADFGWEFTGQLEVDVTASSGTVVDFAQEDALWHNRVRADHTHTNANYQFCDRNILRDGRQIVGQQFMQRGGRIVQLVFRNMTGPVTIHALRWIDRRYPFTNRNRFFCGDYRLNRLWNVCRETISACVTDVFTDCPWRERLFFTNDLVVENRIALQLFSDARLHRHALEMVFSEIKPGHLMNCTCPSVVFESGEINPIMAKYSVILSANLTLPGVLLDYYMYTGDSQTVHKFYPSLETLFGQFKKMKNKKGNLVPPDTAWNFFDWSYENNGISMDRRESSLLNLMYIIAGRDMLKLASMTGQSAPETAENLDAMLEKTLEYFWLPSSRRLAHAHDCAASAQNLKELGVPNPDHAIVPVSSRLPHALAILAGAKPTQDLLDGILDESLLSPDLFYWFFIIQALKKLGRTEEIRSAIEKYWQPVLDTGSPTLYEAAIHGFGKIAWGGSASLCHGFSTAPVDYLQTMVLGISPTMPGFQEFDFHPRDFSAGFARGSIATPYGLIHAQWRFDNGKIEAEVSVPEGCQANTFFGKFGPGVHHT